MPVDANSRIPHWRRGGSRKKPHAGSLLRSLGNHHRMEPPALLRPVQFNLRCRRAPPIPMLYNSTKLGPTRADRCCFGVRGGRCGLDHIEVGSTACGVLDTIPKPIAEAHAQTLSSLGACMLP